MKARLIEGLEKLQLSLNNTQADQLIHYIELLQKWNHVYNLTAVREPEAMLTQHILDSISMVNLLKKHTKTKETIRILDVGSGAGLPAVPLAIAQPEWFVTALDGHHKRTAFVQQVIIELKLSHVNVVQSRVEQWKPPYLFDIVISRAFAELNDFVTLTHQHIAADGLLVAMKGVYPYEEVDRLSGPLILDQVESVEVPFLNAQRHAVILKRSV